LICSGDASKGMSYIICKDFDELESCKFFYSCYSLHRALKFFCNHDDFIVWHANLGVNVLA